MLWRDKCRPGAYQRPRPWALLPPSIIPHIRIVVTGVGWLAGKHSKANVSLWFGTRNIATSKLAIQIYHSSTEITLLLPVVVQKTETTARRSPPLAPALSRGIRHPTRPVNTRV